jgi:hypothetical protein
LIRRNTAHRYAAASLSRFVGHKTVIMSTLPIVPMGQGNKKTAANIWSPFKSALTVMDAWKAISLSQY